MKKSFVVIFIALLQGSLMLRASSPKGSSSPVKDSLSVLMEDYGKPKPVLSPTGGGMGASLAERPMGPTPYSKTLGGYRRLNLEDIDTSVDDDHSSSPRISRALPSPRPSTSSSSSSSSSDHVRNTVFKAAGLALGTGGGPFVTGKSHPKITGTYGTRDTHSTRRDTPRGPLSPSKKSTKTAWEEPKPKA